MPIVAVLPETCDIRRPSDMWFDGVAFSAQWTVVCPGGLEGGEILIEGLEQTGTDVLVRYEITPGVGESHHLTAATTAFVVPEPQGRLGILGTYGALGVQHILEGIDHLIFVFALVLLIRDRWTLVKTITAFTVAHSLSLGAATLGWVVVPSAPVEAVIALSIMFLAAELLRPAEQGWGLTSRYPWIVAFLFGLLHGLGFARGLLDIGLPKGEIPLTLFAFNVGVEIGQLMFIASVLALGWLLGRLYPMLIASLSTRGQVGLRTLGYAIGSVASFWFVTRIAAF